MINMSATETEVVWILWKSWKFFLNWHQATCISSHIKQVHSCEGEFPHISFSLALLFVHYVHFLPLWCKKETWLYYFCKYHFFPKVNLNSPCSESYLWVSLVGIVNLWSTPSLTLRSYSLWFLPLNLSFFFFFAPIPRHFFFYRSYPAQLYDEEHN